MKKSLSIFLFLLLALTTLIYPSQIVAQGDFACTYLGPRAGCVWADARCDSGYEPTNVYCERFTDIDPCNSAPRTSCIALGSSCQPRGFFGCPGGTRQCPTDGTICCANLSECPAPPPGGGGTGDYFKPSTCGECPPGDEAFCAKYPSIQTALGCIPTHPVAFISQFMLILLGVGGGIAFLLMIVGAAFVLTSRGQPEQVQRGKQVFVGALAGLLMIIFGTFLLELIGVDIIGIF